MRNFLRPFILSFFSVATIFNASAQSGKRSTTVFPASSVTNTQQTINSVTQRVGNPNTNALAGYYTQGFENTTFPPAGWQSMDVQGPLVWARSTAQKKSGVASAYMSWEPLTGEDWLIMPKFSVASTDSLVFWLAVQYVLYPPDSLLIKVSTTDSALASFDTTILELHEGAGYPLTTNTFERHAVSLSAFAGQQIYVSFYNININGDGIWIDNVALGTPFADDVATLSVDMAMNVGMSPQFPKATVTNAGLNTQTFNVTMDISGGYTSTMPVIALASNAFQQITFANWTPATTGTYTVTVYTQLAGDAYTANDTVITVVSVFPKLTNYGWSSKPAMPGSLFGMASAFSHAGLFPGDTSLVYAIGGFDSAFAIGSTNNEYSTISNSWGPLSPIPTARAQFSAQTVNGKIYVMGGYTTGFTPTTSNDIYDIATGTWNAGAIMPVAVGDYAIGVYNDSLIYYIGGYDGAGDVNNVQIYNTYTDSWSTGTAITAIASSGLRGGVSGNNIVVVGGYSQILGGPQSQATLGVINPANPTSITWTPLPNYPGGTVGRHSGGSVYNNFQSLVIFTGGDPAGTGSTVLNETWGYEVTAGVWKIGPPKITGVNNVCNLLGGVANDSIYMMSVGGYTGSVVSNQHEWLNLGPAIAGSGINQLNTNSYSVNIFPNPFSDKTSIGLTLAQGSQVSITIMDVQGKNIAEICNKKLSTGDYRFTWNSENAPKGIYIARILIDNAVINKKLVKN